MSQSQETLGLSQWRAKAEKMEGLEPRAGSDLGGGLGRREKQQIGIEPLP